MLRLLRHLFVLVVLVACKSPPPASHAPERVVSLSPSTTEAVFAVGAGRKLVGRSRYCDYPPEVKALPQVGGYVDPSLEAILALKPDLVVGDRGPAGSAIADKLAARGVATYFPASDSFDAIDAMILGVGERLGQTTQARAEVGRLHAQIADVERTVGALPKTRVMVVFGLAPLSVAGPGSFVDEMIRRAGGANVVTQGGPYPSIGPEQVITLDPDLVVNAAMMEAHADERLRKDAPEWSRVRAVVQGHVTSIKDEAMLRPGPRIGDGVVSLARALHPDAKLP